MTSEMQLPESEAIMDEAEHNKKLEETWQSLCIHGVSPNLGGSMTADLRPLKFFSRALSAEKTGIFGYLFG